MRYLKLLELVSLRDLRQIFFSVSIIMSGLILAGLTLWAHQSGNPQLAGLAAGASLLFVLLILIFVIPPLARSASAEAAQMDLPMEITTGGAIYFALITIVGFAAWNTGNNLLFMILAFLISALLVAFVLGNFCLRKVDVKMRFPEAVFAGEVTPVIVSLHNRKRLFPTFSVVAEVRGREREESSIVAELKDILPEKWLRRLLRPPIVKYVLDYFVYVPRRLFVENRIEHVFPRRGRFMVKDFELSTNFPFGFMRHRRRLSAQEAEITIFPRPQPLEKEFQMLWVEAGKFTSQKRGAGQDLLTLREYRRQDDRRHVDWKATARAGDLMVREFAAEDERRVTVVFQPEMAFNAPPEKKNLRQRIEEEQKGKRRTTEEEKRFEAGVAQAASLLNFFTERRIEVCLVVGEKATEFGFGRQHLYACLKELAVTEPKAGFAKDASLDGLPPEIAANVERSYLFVLSSRKQPAETAPAGPGVSYINY